MSQVHNALRRGPLGRAIKNAVGDTTTDGMLERWGETLQPVLDPWSMPEWAYLRGERLAGGVVDMTGAAGTIPEGMLYNPPGSKRLGVVMRLRWYWAVLGTGFSLRIFRGALPAGFTTLPLTIPLDTRDPLLNIPTPGTGLVLYGAANAAASGNAFDLASQTAVNIVSDDEPIVVLAPGSGLSFGPNAVGVQRFIGSIRWRERAAFPDELSA